MHESAGSEGEEFAADHRAYNPVDPEGDCMRPPSVPTLVFCLHCGNEYDSSLMEYRVSTHDGDLHGFWCCGIEGCDGIGFCFDIFPVDPDYVDPDGRDVGHWVDDPPPDPQTDPGRPPTVPTPVRCETCGRTYGSVEMRWVNYEDNPETAGWYCADPACESWGFGDGVRPTDPAYVDEWDRKFYRPGELSASDAWPLTDDDWDIPF